VPTQAQCALTGVTAAQYGSIAANSASQYNGFLGGNPKLQPEKSDTYSVGLVFQPSFVEHLMVSVDYFNIKVQDTIGAIGADTIINNCISTSDPVYCGAIHRDPNGSIWKTNNGFISDTNVNFGSLSTKGIDIKSTYRIGLPAVGSQGLGSVMFDFEGTKLIALNTQPLTDGPTYNCVGFYGTTCGASNPSWRHVFNTTWSTPWDAMDITLRWRFIGDVDSQLTSTDPQLTGKSLPLTSHIGAYSYIDLTTRFQLYKGVSLQVGVNNIADKDPPVMNASGGGFASNCPTITTNGSSCNGNTWPGTYDAMGRFLFAHLVAQF
jgi:outer membrane receptor protein involved in Fe transport